MEIRKFLYELIRMVWKSYKFWIKGRIFLAEYESWVMKYYLELRQLIKKNKGSKGCVFVFKKNIYFRLINILKILNMLKSLLM